MNDTFSPILSAAVAKTDRDGNRLPFLMHALAGEVILNAVRDGDPSIDVIALWQDIDGKIHSMFAIQEHNIPAIEYRLQME